MKKFLSLIFFAALMVFAFASPPPDQKVQEPQLLSITQAEYQAPVVAVTGYDSFYTFETVYADQLPENHLMASLSIGEAEYAPPNEGTDEPVAKNPLMSWENLIGLALLLLTTIFGTLWGKVSAKLTEARDLLDTLIKYLEDKNLSAAELSDLKYRVKKLIGKTG